MALKGFTIILVVFRHAIQRNIITYATNPAFIIIGSFHMQLFMLLSGYVIYGRVGDQSLRWLLKKSKVLLIPFFAWAIIYYFWNTYILTDPFMGPYVHSAGSLPHFLIQSAVFPYIGLWYLWVLFLIYCILVIVKLLQPYLKDFSFLLIIVILYLVPLFGKTLFQANYLRYYFTFFATGYLFAKYKDNLIRFLPYAAITSLICSPLLLIHPHVNYTILALAIDHTAAFSGIILVYYIFDRLKDTNLVASWLSWVGIRSLDIYAAQFLFLKIGFGYGILKVISVTIVAFGGCLLLSYLVRKSEFLSKLLYGIWPKNNRTSLGLD